MRNALLLVLLAVAIAPVLAQCQSPRDLHRVLDSRSFRGVHGSAEKGVVTLAGSVALYSTKLRAEERMSRVHGVTAIRDEIQVAGPRVPDSKLESELRYRIAFNSAQVLGELPDTTETIAVHVRNGVVTLENASTARNSTSPQLASIAFATAANTVGVRGLIDRVHVRPGMLPIQNFPDGTGLSTP